MTSATSYTSSGAALPPTAAILHEIVSVFAPAAQAVQPVLEWIAPHGAKFDAWFEANFGPCHELSRNFPLMVPHHALLMGVGYLLFVLISMPLLQTLKLSLKMKPVMRLYNMFMVVLSFYMAARGIMLAREQNDSLMCVPLVGDRMAQLVWIFTYSKTVEFLDTFFMIVEGRWRQVSFLHVYHHVSILSYWFTILWKAPGSDAYVSLIGNSFIHVLMYGYYLLASFGYSPWWKFYITKAQILQFVIFAAHSIYVGYVLTEKVCDFPDVLSRGLLWYMLTLIALFTHFLVTNKGKKKKSKGTLSSSSTISKPLKTE